MENQRQTFRQFFEPGEVLQVELQRPGRNAPIPGELLDLSLGGMRVRVRGASPALQMGDAITARLIGRGDPAPVELGLAVPARIVHLDQRGEDCYYGIHFLPTASPSTNENIERTLGRFLLAEQRRKRQQSQTEPRP